MALRVAENIKMLSGREFGRELETALSDEQLVRLFPDHSVTGIAVENLCTLDFISIIGFEIKFTDSSDTNTHYYNLFLKYGFPVGLSGKLLRFYAVANCMKLVDKNGNYAIRSFFGFQRAFEPVRI